MMSIRASYRWTGRKLPENYWQPWVSERRLDINKWILPVKFITLEIASSGKCVYCADITDDSLIDFFFHIIYFRSVDRHLAIFRIQSFYSWRLSKLLLNVYWEIYCVDEERKGFRISETNRMIIDKYQEFNEKRFNRKNKFLMLRR